jgi:quercetin dioxygenase-like cupin family protein
MIRTGQTIENPITGERVTFRRTAADTEGAVVVVEVFVKPHGFVAARHVHPNQEERFEILSGALELMVGADTLTAQAGDRVVVSPGTPHSFRNAGHETAHFVCEVRPALQFESLLETMYTLAADGKTNGKGMPNPLRLAVVARAHFDTVQLPFPPARLQQLGLALAAPLGRLLGYPATYKGSDASAAFGV